ncbi:EFR3 [[Candida] subhashii]|uniref:Protein EFR3 n=1 Tax=[Candida] subhashii TaxID=561895 RepID=A0A8J5QFH6_9ASCO|nr:EFR3 [[Candida] subhashii]KAG7663576.1 EFR3 [[Candida] subhashii]
MSMKKLFRHKHQNLIEQCYPPGKAVDKKANPSELSYLLYYASTRRVKLEKVIKYLEERTAHHAKHNRTGNLQVTLQIVKGLIEKCSDNLNVFAQQVCGILRIALDTKDIALCKSAVSTYAVFCEKLEGPLFTGDKIFVVKFTEITKSLISYGKCGSGPNQYEWQMISLVAISHLCKCLGHNASVSKQFIVMSIPMLAGMIHTNTPEPVILSRLRSNVNVESEDQRLSRIVSSKNYHRNISEQINDNFENDELTLDDITEAAFTAMKAFFDTNSTNQVLEATKAVIDYNIYNIADLDRGVTFLELCISWVPIQLRFIGLTTILITLTEVNKGVNEEEYQFQYQYAHHLLGLLSSKVNMIGLSVTDIIQQLLGLQSDIILKPNRLTKEQGDILTDIYSDCICNLTTHIYYFDQVPDSVQEILVKIEYTLDSSFIDPTDPTDEAPTANQVHDLIIQFLTNVSKIFTILRSKSSSISRNHASLEHWEHTVEFLAPQGEYEDKTTVLSNYQINNIQRKFLQVFDDFLNNELASSVQSSDNISEGMDSDSKLDSATTPSGRRNSTDAFGSGIHGTANDLLRPNVNRYIAVQQNFISHFLIYVEKFFDEYPSADIDLLVLLTTVLKDMIDILGMNFLANFIPFFHHWSLGPHVDEPNERQKLQDTLGYTLMYYSISRLDEQYVKNLDGYAKSSELYELILDAVDYRKKRGFWLSNIEGSDSELETAVLGRAIKSDKLIRVQKKDIEDFACGNNSLIVWLHPQKPYITDIDRTGTGIHVTDFNNTTTNNNNGHVIINNHLEENMVPNLIVTPNSRPSSENLSSNSEKGLYTGLGLGTAVDINCIQSEIVQFNQVFPQKSFPFNPNLQESITNVLGVHESNGSIFTADSKHPLVGPKVVDLKDLMVSTPESFRMPRRSSEATSIVAPGSILHKHIQCNDVSSILDGLDSDDDAAIVV